MTNFEKRKGYFIAVLRKIYKETKKIAVVEGDFEEPPKATKQ